MNGRNNHIMTRTRNDHRTVRNNLKMRGDVYRTKFHIQNFPQQQLKTHVKEIVFYIKYFSKKCQWHFFASSVVATVQSNSDNLKSFLNSWSFKTYICLCEIRVFRFFFEQLLNNPGPFCICSARSTFLTSRSFLLFTIKEKGKTWSWSLLNFFSYFIIKIYKKWLSGQL